MNVIICAAAFLGGIDKILGNRFGLGKRFDEGFRLIGPLMSGMTGILCLSPLLARVIRSAFSLFLGRIGLDPAMLGGILPIDMGGFQLAAELASDPKMGRFAGVFLASTFGCTVIFSIPVGFSMMKEENRSHFLLGILYGLLLLPIPLLAGGFFCGLDLHTILVQNLPVLLLTLLLMLWMRISPRRLIRFFMILAKIIETVSAAGILIGLAEYLTGFSILPGIMPLPEAIRTAALCGLIMIGSLPFAEIISRLLHRPLLLIGRKTGMREDGITSLLLSTVSLAAAFGVMHSEESRDITVNAAFLVSAAAAFGPHLAVLTASLPELTAAFIIIKLAAGFCSAALALLLLDRKGSRTA